MAHDKLGIPVHRFTVKQLHRMRETGVLAPQARLELLDGLLVDKQRPTARELEAIQRIAGVLAEHLDAPIVACEPNHPDDYATFDATIMVHDWQHLPLTEPWPLHRFSLAEFDRLFETGILANATTLELMDGVVLDASAPPPDVAIAEIAARVAAETSGVMQRRSSIEFGPYSRLWIDIAVCRPRPVGYDAKPASGADVLLAVDIASPPHLAQELRWPLYARWGVKAAWIVDPVRAGVRIGNFSGSD